MRHNPREHWGDALAPAAGLALVVLGLLLAASCLEYAIHGNTGVTQATQGE